MFFSIGINMHSTSNTNDYDSDFGTASPSRDSPPTAASRLCLAEACRREAAFEAAISSGWNLQERRRCEVAM